MSTAESLPPRRPDAGADYTVCYAVHSAADPGMLPRVIGQWSKRGLTPARCHSAVCGPADSELYIDLELRGLDAGVAARIADDLRQIWGVTLVLMTLERTPAPR